MIAYITFSDMCRDIRENLWKIPRDVCGVVGIARSGLLPATVISELLNVGLTSLGELITCGDLERAFSDHGGRPMRTEQGKKILIVDDTCFAGTQKKGVSELIKKTFGSNTGYEFIYLVVYMEGTGEIFMPDIYLRDVRQMAKDSQYNIVLYEWNIFNHYPSVMNRMMFDYDGVFCVDPPDERNTEEYLNYIKDPIPLFIPTVKGETNLRIVTYRLNKYRKESEDFLLKNGIGNFTLTMNAAETYEERGKIPPSAFKGSIYKESDAILFIESEDWQAQQIHAISGKPVFCVSTNKMYN